MKEQNQMPPVIRVFLSSTFSDMERERTYFNEELAPKISRICAQRGVSFFSVDLRWGITQEDQINGQVLPICLGEIDKCRPYFIGILGSRYGSVMETVPEHLGSSIPWLRGREGTSITELEMLYAVLDHPDAARNCGFYFRAEVLSREWYGDTQEDARLTRLKRRIRENPDIPGWDYGSLEAFGERVIADITGWLDREFPEPEQVAQVRRSWYNGELLRGYLPVADHSRFLNAYLRDSRRSLLFYGDGGRGKTTFLTAWEPEQGQKLLINCGSDDAFTYWPGVLRQVVEGITALDGGGDLMANMEMTLLIMRGVHDNAFYFTSREDEEALRLGFVRWLQDRRATEPVYVVINDLNLLSDESGHLLSWLPAAAVGNVQFICSTNLQEMVDNATTLNWNCRELPTFPSTHAGEFLVNYLSIYGKGLSPEQRQSLLTAPGAAYPGQLRVMADFLIDYGRFHNLEELISGLSRTENPYEYIYRYFVSRKPKGEGILLCVLGLLRCARRSLQEGDCYRLVSQLTYVTAMDWAAARGEFEKLGIINGDYWTLRQKELGVFADSLLTDRERAECHRVLGEYMLSRLQEAETAYVGGVCAGEALYHFACAGEAEALLDTLLDKRVLELLAEQDWRSVRVGWMWLLLNTDMDVPGLVEGLIVSDSGDTALSHVLSSLPVDLGLGDVIRRGKQSGRKYIGSLTPDYSRCGKNTLRLCQRLLEMQGQRQYHKAIELAREALESGGLQPGMERCQVLFIQLDCQRHLRLYAEMLETANEYYLQSLRCGSLPDLYRAITLRAEALEGLDKAEQALQQVERLERLSAREGDLRGYLAAKHTRGICLYKTGAYEEALQCLAEQETVLGKMGDTRAAEEIVITRCNVLSCMEDHRAALDTARNAFEKLPDTPEYEPLRCILLGNMGAYALELEQYAEAETYLLKAGELAEAAGRESVLFRARQGLIKIYERTDRFVAASELYEKQLALHWSRGEYGRVLELLEKAEELLLANKYGPAARQLHQRWAERFAGIPGGEEMLRYGADGSVSDRQTVDTLEEQLTMARSEGDPGQIAKACEELFHAVGTRDADRATEYALQAVEHYRQAGDEESVRRCQVFALSLQIDGGRILSEARYRRVLEVLPGDGLHRVAEIWEAIGAVSNQEKHPTTEQQQAVAEMTRELLSLSGQQPQAVMLCAMDVLKTLVTYAAGEDILALTRAVPHREMFVTRLERTIMEDSQKDIDQMTKDYASPTAEERLAFYEKCIPIMDTLEMRNVANLSGNLALIFRRRREKEKTLRYHEISRKHFKAQGMIRDELIEYLNLATAYDQFGEPQQAVEILRQALREAQQTSEWGSAAAIAGNLAAYLMNRGHSEDREEIIRCFAVEESYFRGSGAERELAISLHNQVKYLMSRGKREEWEPKLREFGQIVRKNNFREFEQNLVRMEWIAQKDAAPRNLEESGIRELMTRLLASREMFRLEGFSVKDGMYHGQCVPCKENPTGYEMLHLYLHPQSPNELLAVFLFQPGSTGEGTAEAMNAYAAWWNSLKNYELSVHGSYLVLQAVCRIMAPDADALIDRFNRHLDLWMVDALSAGMMGAGICDLSIFQGMKLQVFTEGQ